MDAKFVDGLVVEFQAVMDDLFGQCCSNPVLSSWGHALDFGLVNDAKPGMKVGAELGDLATAYLAINDLLNQCGGRPAYNFANTQVDFTKAINFETRVKRFYESLGEPLPLHVERKPSVLSAPRERG